MRLNATTLWVMFIVIGAGTFLIRLSFIHLLGKFSVSATFKRLLRFVPPAVLAALIAPAILVHNGQLAVSAANGKIAAAAVAAAVALVGKNAVLTIGTGMAALWLFRIWGL
jgi:branched-subunit amino acid transport protein